MKSRRSSYVVLVSIISIFLLTSAGHADWKKEGGILGGIGQSFPGPYYLLHNKDALNLNASQVEQLKRLKLRSQKTKTQKYADIEILRIELKEILDEKSVDKKAVKGKIESLGKLYAQVAKNQVITRLTARELLTDKQFHKWEMIIEDRVSLSWRSKEQQ